MFIDMYKRRPIIFLTGLLFLLLNVRVVFAQQNDANSVVDNPNTTLNRTNPGVQVSKIPQVITHLKQRNEQLSLNELRAIFSLRARKWPDGTPITVFVLRDEDEFHREFLLKTLKMLPHQLRRQWDRYIYSGIGQGPTVVNSQADMLTNVKATPGGIGYIEGGVLDGSVYILPLR